MAGRTITTQPKETINSKNSDNRKSLFGRLAKNKLIGGLAAFVIAVGIILLVLGGTFYILMKNNVNGVGERYRENLKDVPLLNRALPKAPDPNDPKYMSTKELTEKYSTLLKENEELNNKVAELGRQNDELNLYKNSEGAREEENEGLKKQIEEQALKLEEEKKQMAEERKKLDELIASGDKAGFKQFFENIDKENAQRIYTSIINEQKASEDTKKFVQLYENMDAAVAAKIFEQMGSSKIDLVVDILRNANKEAASEIIASMTPAFASKVTEKLSKIYMKAEGQGN